MKFLLDMLRPEQVETFGLDIGSQTVKAVKMDANNDGGFKAVNIGLKDLRSVKSSGDHTRDTIRAIQDCLSQASIGSEHAVCGVNGPEVAVRSFTFPKMPLEEIGQAVVLEAEQVCPFEIKQSIVDYNLTDSDDGKVHGVLVAATADTITKKSLLAKKANLKPVLMDAESLAIINCFDGCKKENLPATYGILNFGSSEASLIITHSNRAPFVRALQYSGNDIIKWFCDSNGMKSSDAYDLVFGNVQPDDPAQFQSDITMACSNVVNDIAETLRFYSSDRNKNVEKIFLCGGFSCSENIVNILANNILCDVELWNPFESIELGKNIDDESVKKYGPSFAVAAGLAMRKV